MTFPDFGPTAPLAPPLVPSSVYRVPDLDALDELYAATTPGFTYARDGHPNAHHLAAELAALSGASWGLVTGSGMAALAAAFLAVLSPGDRVLAGTRLYGGTAKLLARGFRRLGVEVDTVDTSDVEAVAAALAVPTKLLVTETLSNPLCRAADLPALAEVAHARGALLLVDNTFATPVLCRPLEWGADLVMESLTKMIGGHSDVTLGFLAGKDAALRTAASTAAGMWGLVPSAFDCWLVQRGLATLDVRVRAAAGTAAAVADWLPGRPGVTRVVYPGRPDHPDHALASKLLGGGCGHVVCFELAGGRAAVNAFMRSAPGIPFCPSLGHAETTCSYPAATSHRDATPAEQAAQGITPGLVRLSVGCEPAAKVTAELARGLGG